MEKKKRNEEKDRIFIVWLERNKVWERRNGRIACFSIGLSIFLEEKERGERTRF